MFFKSRVAFESPAALAANLRGRGRTPAGWEGLKDIAQRQERRPAHSLVLQIRPLVEGSNVNSFRDPDLHRLERTPRHDVEVQKMCEEIMKHKPDIVITEKGVRRGRGGSGHCFFRREVHSSSGRTARARASLRGCARWPYGLRNRRLDFGSDSNTVGL